MQCHCLQRWMPTWHSTVHQLSTWILITPLLCLLPVIYRCQSPAQHAFPPLVPQLPFPSSSFHSFIKSLHLNLPKLSEMSALTMLPLLFLPLYLLSSYLSSHMSSSHSPASSKLRSRLRSNKISRLFELETAFSPSPMFPPTTRSHLSSSSARPIFPVFPVSSCACFMLLHLLSLLFIFLLFTHFEKKVFLPCLTWDKSICPSVTNY